MLSFRQKSAYALPKIVSNLDVSDTTLLSAHRMRLKTTSFFTPHCFIFVLLDSTRRTALLDFIKSLYEYSHAAGVVSLYRRSFYVFKHGALSILEPTSSRSSNSVLGAYSRLEGIPFKIYTKSMNSFSSLYFRNCKWNWETTVVFEKSNDQEY